MADTQSQTPKRKRPTRAQLSERLSIPLGPKNAAESAEEAAAFAASRQRIRDRAGDEALPRGTGRARK